MKTIKAKRIAPGMVLTMFRWIRQNDRRPLQVKVKSIDSTEPFRATLESETGEQEIYHNGHCMVTKPYDRELRVTFQIDEEKYPLSALNGKSIILADKNGETALWNILSPGVFQLPDDECCDSRHSAEELMNQGYTIA